MSVRLLTNMAGSDAAHELSDDLESFAWLVLDIAVGTLKWECPDYTAERMKLVFSDSKYLNSEWRGGLEKRQALRPRALKLLCFIGNPALTLWWQSVHGQLTELYRILDYDVTPHNLPLQDHIAFKTAFETALSSDGWAKIQHPTRHDGDASPEPRHPQHGRLVSVPPFQDPGAIGDTPNAMGSIDEEGQPPAGKKVARASASKDSSGRPSTRSRKVVPSSDRVTRASSRKASSEAGPSSQPG
jgi:hypothetical protein